MSRSVDGVSLVPGGAEAVPGARDLAAAMTVDPGWIPDTPEAADMVVERWTQRKIDALLRERGLDDEVETTRRFVTATIPEYADRFLLELLQNGHDALPADGLGRIRIELDLDAMPYGELVVANTGLPFRYRDFRSLCRMGQSEKRPGEGIGHKGVGFKSVLQVALQPEIYSAATDGCREALRGFRFTFPDEARYEELFSSADELVPRMTPYSLPVVIPVDQQPVSVRRLAAEGYATVIRLRLGPLSGPTARGAIQDILSSAAPVLLFLHRIHELHLVISEGRRSEEHRLTRTPINVAVGERARVDEVDLGEAGRFLVATGDCDEVAFRSAIAEDVLARRADEGWLKWTGVPEVSVGVPLDPTQSDDRLYCYLPMQASARSPIAGHVNGPFAIGLARKELIPGSHINEILLNAAADVAVDAALEVKAQTMLRSTVVDLVAWPRDGGRLVEAWRRRGCDPVKVEVVPVLGDQAWASFGNAWCWDPQGTSQLTASAMAGLISEPLIDPAIGRERVGAIAKFGAATLGLDLEPGPDLVAAWAEAFATRLHRTERTNTQPSSAWLEFYDDLPTVFVGTTGRALAGRHIILGERNELLAAWDDADRRAHQRTVQRGVFFAAGGLDDPGVDAAEGRFVPRSLRRTLARVHPDLDWFVPGEAGRRNRPGRVFLEDQSLVRVPRIEDLLRIVERVLLATRSSSVWREALIFVYQVTRPGPRRPDLGTLGLQRLGLRVPAGGGWVPSRRALFSRGWTDLGGQLSDLVTAAGSVSVEIAALGERLLDAADSWIPKRTTVDEWLELLGYCGVHDGLAPVALGPTASPPARQGWWWAEPEHIAEHYRINEPDRTSWLRAVDLGSWPRHPGAEYVLDGRPFRIPGQTDFDRFPEKARFAFAHLVLAGLGVWPDGVLSFAVHRRTNQGDAKRFPSPAKVFMTTAAWLRVSRPGSGGEDDWVAPSGAWLIMPSEREPFFAPVLDAQLRGRIVESSQGRGRLIDLGAHVWTEPGHAAAKLKLLGQLLHDGRVLPGLIAQVRNAVEDTWKTILETNLQLPFGGSADIRLVVARREQLDTVSSSGGEPFFILGSADRMLDLVLASLGEPVLVVGGDIGQHVWAQLQAAGLTNARLILPSDLVVEVDGQPVTELPENAEQLVAGDRNWLADLIALTLELKPTAFRLASETVVQNALERFTEIRLIPGLDVALRLDGHRREVPTYSRRVVPTVIGGTSAIAWVPGEAGIDWRGLSRLAPAISELIRERGAREALLNVIHTLSRGGGTLEEPSDDQYADAFGVSEGRIRELRRSHRDATGQVLLCMVPVIACLVGLEEAIRMRARAIKDPDTERGLAGALEALRDRLPGHLPVEVLLEAVRSSRRIRDAREKLGIDFAEMNRALDELGAPYAPELHPDQHATVVSGFLATHRDDIADALRVRAITAGVESPDALDSYAASVAALDAATREARQPNAADLLAPDPAWLLEHLEPPDFLISARVADWLSTQEAPTLGTTSGREAASVVRAVNGGMLSALLPRIALVIDAWIDGHGTCEAPGWTTNPEAMVRDLALSGRLDFERVEEDGVIQLLVARQAWPAEMDRTIDLARLGLREDDLQARRSAEERRRTLAERAKRGVEVAGRIVTLDLATVGPAISHILDTISPASLNVPVHEVSLRSAPAHGRRRGRGGGRAGGAGAAGGGRTPKEKLETIGLIGETVAWAWLRHHFGGPNVLWRSCNRAFAIHDGDGGDDERGFDFEILHGRSRLYYEVKASTGDPREFELSEGEVRFALSKAHTATYRVLYIGYVNAPSERVILPLPNPLANRSRDRYRVSETGIRYAFAAADATG